MGPLGPTAASGPPVEGAPGWASCCPSVPISHTAPHGASHLVHGLALWRPPHPTLVLRPSGTFTAQTDWSSGWKSLKQKPSFLEGRSMSSQQCRRTVPTHWPTLGVL